MSAIAGIFHTNPRDRVPSEALHELEDSIRFLGPDDSDSVCVSSVGLVQCALHTTLESESQRLPLCIGSSWLTWDGRLDNRPELADQLETSHDSSTSDATLVLLAYQRWGLNAFERLEGDFALCIWDAELHRIVLVRDPMGIKQLFLRRDSNRYVWCSALEPLVLQARRPLTLNVRHVYKLFSAQPCLDSTCYEEIFSIPPGNIVMLRADARPVRKRYWSLPAGQMVRYRCDSEYDEHFRFLLEQSISRRLRSNGRVAAELSGGLDSSTIVCIADQLEASEGTPPVETISYFNSNEPSGDERPYIQIVESQRGRPGHRIAVADFHRRNRGSLLRPLEDPFQASPGRFANSLEWQKAIHECQEQIGARVLLSGAGGDELLGAVPFGAPTVAEHLLNGKIIMSFRSLLEWSISRQQTLLTGLDEVVELLKVRQSPQMLLERSAKPFPWLMKQDASDVTAVTDFSEWRHLTSGQFASEWQRCTLAGQFTINGTSYFGDTEIRYPLLDRRLFQFLAGIPRDQISRPGKRRLLQRRALRGIVPNQILDRKTKWFGVRSAHEALRSAEAEQFFSETWLSSGIVFDMKLLREAYAAVKVGSPGAALPLQMAIGFEQWLRIQVDRGTIALPTR